MLNYSVAELRLYDKKRLNLLLFLNFQSLFSGKLKSTEYFSIFANPIIEVL